MAKHIYSGADEILQKLQDMGYDIDVWHPIKSASAFAVYKATLKGEKRFIKIMNFEERIDFAKRYRQLVNEFRAVSKNDNNCLVQIIDDDEDPREEKEGETQQASNFTYIVMECGDYSLEDLIKRGKVDAKKAIKAAKNTTNALIAVASRGEGWVHRDVKPANIIVFENYDEVGAEEDEQDKDEQEGKEVVKDRFKLSDFHTMAGIDKELEDPNETISSFTKGTHEYMAPELDLEYEAKNPDKEARDIYSMGIVLYQLLTGTSQDDLTKLKPLRPKESAKLRYRNLQKSPGQFFAYLGLGPEEETQKVKDKSSTEEGKKEEFKPVIDNVILKEIIKKCLFFDPEKEETWRERFARGENVSSSETPWHGRYQRSKDLLDDLRVAELNDDYEDIKDSLSVNINATDAAEKRSNVESTWKFVFKELYGIKNGEYKRNRRGQNWLLDKFEDEVIAKKVEEDRIKIDEFYQKVSKPEVKKKIKGITYLKGISLALDRYASIWETHDSLMWGYRGNIQLISHPNTSVNKLRQLAKEYNPSTRIDDICGCEAVASEGTEAKKGTKIENEDIADNVEAELNQIKAQIEEEVANPEFDEIKEIIDPKELGEIVNGLKAKIQGKLDEIKDYRDKAERVCTAARAAYKKPLTPGQVHPTALNDALDVFKGAEYRECRKFFRVAAARAELMYLDVMVRKMCAVSDDVDKLKGDAEKELEKTGEREYAGSVIARELATNRSKIGKEDFKELVEQKGREYFRKGDYENALFCFEQLDQEDTDVIACMGKTISSIGDGKKGEEQIEVYTLALKYCDRATVKGKKEYVDWQIRTKERLEEAKTKVK